IKCRCLKPKHPSFRIKRKLIPLANISTSRNASSHFAELVFLLLQESLHFEDLDRWLHGEVTKRLLFLTSKLSKRSWVWFGNTWPIEDTSLCNRSLIKHTRH